MDKTRFNFVIDALMFLTLMAMAGLGFLMKYVLVPGRVAWVKYGRNVELTWLGWDRHDWGEVHLYLAFFLLGVLTIHLILHWKMILGLYERLIPDPPLRTKVAYAFLIVAALLISFSFLVTPEVRERGRGPGRHSALGGEAALQVVADPGAKENRGALTLAGAGPGSFPRDNLRPGISSAHAVLCPGGPG